jgi:peptide/nickel transport system substrate-binding protein
MTKRILLIALILMVVVTLVAACGKDDTSSTTTASSATPGSTTATSAPATTAPTAPASTETTAAPLSDIVLNVTPAGQGATTFTYNFNPFTSSYLFPTYAGIYEPMMINNRMTGELVPWLATEYKWSDDLLSLTFTLRDGVKWSDNTDFTSADVVYTFDALKNNEALGGNAKSTVAQGGFIDSVTAPDPKTVVFKFNKVYTPGLYDLVTQYIVPEHIWKAFADASKELNLKPVGTGPYTEIVNTSDQSYEVDRNPYYWQADKLYVKGLRVLAYSGDDAVATMLAGGDVDWAGQGIMNLDKAVLANNPDIKAWWPDTALQTILVNGTVKPFDDPIVRKAMGYSFDREKLSQIGSQGLGKPADITGIADAAYKGWKVDDVNSLGVENWCTYDPAKANQMLDAAGYAKGADGIRTNKDGTPWVVELPMVNGFANWIAIAPTLKEELEAIGFSINIVNYDPGQWFGKLFMGDFAMTVFFGLDGETPYQFYRNAMSQQTFRPVGQPTSFMENFGRVVVPEAEAALQKFSTSTDPAVQHEAAIELQKLHAQYAPDIPLFTSQSYGTYNAAKVGGWASADNQICWPMCMGQNALSMQLIQMTSWGPAK